VASHRPQRREYLIACLAMVSMLLPGCLASSYRIPADEVTRLQRTAPALRGQKVRVVQRFSSQEQPPRGRGWAAHIAASDVDARRAYSAPRALDHGLYFYIHAGPPTWWPWVPVRPVATSSAFAGQATSRGTGQVVGKSGGGGASLPSNADTEAAIVAVVAAAVIVGISLAATEGARYDGWLALHPDHPVHLMGPKGRREVKYLSHLSLQDVTPGTELVIYRDEGAGSWELGRAPLNRKGMFYGIGLGRVDVPVTGYSTVETSGAVIELGWFPSHYLGVLASISLGWDSVPGGATVTLVQPAFEVQAIPLRLWRFHLGAFAGLGNSVVEADGGPYAAVISDSGVLTFGGLAQLDLTTRLALTFRYGASQRTADDSPLGFMGTLGLSVY